MHLLVRFCTILKILQHDTAFCATHKSPPVVKQAGFAVVYSLCESKNDTCKFQL